MGNQLIIVETIGVICLSLKRDSVLGGDLGGNIPNESVIVFDKFLQRNIQIFYLKILTLQII